MTERNLAYQRPGAPLDEILEAEPLPATSLSPDQKTLAFLQRHSMPSIEELAQPELRLAGLRINPRTSNPSRAGFFLQVTLKELATGQERPLAGLPQPLQIRRLAWSHDSLHMALAVQEGERLTLWLADLATAQARPVPGVALHEIMGAPFLWSGQELICRLLPQGRGPCPQEPLAPVGPVIDENLGERRPARTYQDLLSNPHEEALFTWHASSQLARVTLQGEVTPLGAPGVIQRVSPSPDEAWLLVERIHQPYSYLVQYNRFPRSLEIWDRDGQLVTQIADLPLAEDIPVAYAAVRKGPRSLRWRSDADACLCWAQALDEGDPAIDVPHRDQLFLLEAPFALAPQPWTKLELRFAGLVWGRGDLALIYESWWSTRRVRTWIAAPDQPQEAPRILFDRSWEDRYNDPGSPMVCDTPQGRSVLRTTPDGASIYLTGAGASPQGNRPFLDRLELETGQSQRLWQSEDPWYEQPVEMLDDEGHVILTRRESTEVPPNYFRRDLRDGSLEPLTHFQHPFPQILGSSRELISYRRADGVQLNARLHLPAGYDAERDGPLPVLVWAYPREFKDAQAAGQVRDSPHRFVGVGWWSPLLWLVRGWCVLDDATMPIVGEGDAEPNDSYVEQLVDSARAALDEVARRGVGDPERAAVGGHSYGAFMTANLLAHSELFKAGIARSGAYNRTLTPFGFQAEERTLWEAPETYITMSPFMHADKIKTPLLLVHGQADNNSGTYPMQTERFYKALKGHGATVRMVMLPHESHSYQARESILHMVWETDRWLARYVLGQDLDQG